ncbi:MAG: family 20 glycosylhydrolase [Planctomycetota bacterium]
MLDALDLLLPRPRALLRGTSHWFPSTTRALGLRIHGTQDERPLQALERGLAAAGLRTERRARGSAEIELRLDANENERPETYRLEIDDTGARAWAASTAGLFRAATTIAELLRIGALLQRGKGAPKVPCCALEDGPDLEVRGFMLDISRDRVPTYAELCALIERMARLKLNQLQLYTEHTFAYEGHEDVWRDASPITPQEARKLAAFASERHIALVPNQQCLGHMHRWLTLPRYAPLAELPEGIEHAFSVAKEPFSLCAVDPASLTLIEGLFDQLLPNFEAREVNVGLDETFDLGLGGSQAACDARGKGRVYLEYLNAVNERVRARGRRMQFWGDVILEHPELVPELPKDATAMLWGYDAKHPFERQAARFAKSGLPFQTCPGTSSWQSFGGRIENMRINIRDAARAALRYGAEGMLVCDWGDYGHWQPFPVLLPGLLEGASRAWNVKPSPGDLVDLLVAHGPLARAEAEALVGLGQLDAALASGSENGTALFFLFRYAHQPWPIARCGTLTREGLDAARAVLDEVAAALGRARAEARAAAQAHDPVLLEPAGVVEELAWVHAACTLGVHLAEARMALGDGTSMTGLPAAAAEALLEELRQVAARHGELWSLRSRSGGLTESLGRFQLLVPALEAAASGASV